MASDNRKRVLALGALWLGVTGGSALVTACYAHNCDGDDVQYGLGAGEGNLITPDVWESSPADGDWFPFTKQRVVRFQIYEFRDRIPYKITPYISAEGNPTREGGNWTIGSGNLAEQSGIGPGAIVIKNNTCADYFIRVVVEAPPRAPGAGVILPPTDASVPEAQAPDAAADAGDSPD